MNVADRLLELRADAVLVLAAERGLIAELRCSMPHCLLEDDPRKGRGRGYFERRGKPGKEWAPSADHFPIAARHGGLLVPENIRLSHRACNTWDYNYNPEHAQDRARVSASWTRTEEAKENMRKAAHRRWEDPKQREMARRNQQGKKQSLESSEKKRAAMYKHFEDPAARERASAIVRRRYEDPLEREKIGAKSRGRKASPETRAKMSAARRAHWARMTEEERSLVALKAVHTRDHVSKGIPCPPRCSVLVTT